MCLYKSRFQLNMDKTSHMDNMQISQMWGEDIFQDVRWMYLRVCPGHSQGISFEKNTSRKI